MPTLKTHLVTDFDGQTTLTLYVQGDPEPQHADSTHPQWEEILKRVKQDDPSVVELINPHKALGRVLLSDRVTYDSGRLFFDGDPLSDGLAKLIADLVVKGEDVKPFVNLLDKTHQNPSNNSRKQLHGYIDRNHVSIYPNGDLVLYKYVHRTYQTDKPYRSGRSGLAFVNGVESSGYVHQAIGDTVTVPRSQVVDNPSDPCAFGLHVGAWEYVSAYGDTKLEIRVNARDVVSVPSDHSERKIRVSRYTIVGEVTKPYEERVVRNEKQAKTDEKPQQAAVAAAPANPKHPTAQNLRAAKVTARLQRKGLVNYATNRLKWTLLTGDGSERTHWAV